MRIFDETKTKEITNPDLEKGYLQNDKLLIAHHEAQAEVQEQKHEELLHEYPNGGKEYIEVIDVPYQAAKEAWDEYEDIQVYIPYTEEEIAQIKAEMLRAQRAAQCFPIVNRGALWYEKLTEEQKLELSAWYEAWLDAPATGKVPDAPEWINKVS